MSERISAAQYRKLTGAAPAESRPQIRLPKLSKMNKLEAEYERILRIEFPDENVQYEPLTFRLPSGTNYCPDFVVWNRKQILVVVECKGPYIHSAAALRAFKEARSAFSWLSFRFAQKRAGLWTVAV
jgi:hypothetical protein